MRKVYGVLIFLLMINFVVALDDSSSWTDEEGLGQLEDTIEKYSPLDEYGEVDLDKYKPVVSDAELKIDEINLWLEENALWLKVVFGMVPSISWLFAVNLWLLIFAFIVLVVHGDTTFAIFEFLGKKIDLIFFEVTLRNILGVATLVLLLVSKVFVNVAVFLTNFIDVFWNYILPFGLVVAIVIVILVAIAFIVLLVYAPQFLEEIKRGIDKRKKKKATEKEAVNREALGEIVEGALGN